MNPDQGLYNTLRLLESNHYVEATRNGNAKVFTYPAVISFEDPQARVSFEPLRDANPFFHLMEAMWMLAGRNDVAFPARFSANIANYSVDGVTQHAAYGHRLRRHFGYDQLQEAVNKLRASPATRQVVCTLWSAQDDLRDTPANAKDRACNLMMKYNNRKLHQDSQKVLCLTVYNRSNDTVFGTFGANVVHMSFFLEYVAAATGLLMGNYIQIADDMHCYDAGVYGEKLYENINKLRSFEEPTSPYDRGEVVYINAFGDRDQVALFDAELPGVLDGVGAGRHHFLRYVVKPLMRVHSIFKGTWTRDHGGVGRDAALAELREVEDRAYGEDDFNKWLQQPRSNHQTTYAKAPRLDWFLACEQWLQRRKG